MLSSNLEAWEGIDRGIAMTVGVPGMTLELGVCRGGGSARIIEQIQLYGVKRNHVCIDPYGDLMLAVGDNDYNFDYSNDMRNECIRDLFDFVRDKPLVNLHFFNMTDRQFFKRFADGVPTYADKQQLIVNRYAFLFIDGPHSTERVDEELNFFIPRCSPGAVIVFDNTTNYEHWVIEDSWLESWRIFSTEGDRIGYVHTV